MPGGGGEGIGGGDGGGGGCSGGCGGDHLSGGGHGGGGGVGGGHWALELPVTHGFHLGPLVRQQHLDLEGNRAVSNIKHRTHLAAVFENQLHSTLLNFLPKHK